MWLDLGHCNAWTLHSFSFELRLTLSPRCRSGGSSERYMSQPVTHLDSIWQPWNKNSVQSSFSFFHVLHFCFTDLEGGKQGERWHVTKTTSLNVVVFNGNLWPVRKNPEGKSWDSVYTAIKSIVNFYVIHIIIKRYKSTKLCPASRDSFNKKDSHGALCFTEVTLASSDASFMS